MSANNKTELGDITLDERLGQSETLYFTVRADSPKASDIVPDGELGYRGRRFIITELDELRVGGDKFLEVEAAASWVKLADDTRPGSFVIEAQTVSAGASAIVATTTPAWSAEVDESVDDVTLHNLEAQDATVLDLVRQWANVTGNEFEFDTERRVVRFTAQVGATRGQGFRYGRNVTKVRKRTSAPAVTRLYPYGKNDLDIRGVNGGEAFLEDFSYYTDRGLTLEQARARHLKEVVLVDTSIDSDTDLRAWGIRKLEELADQRINYDLDVIDLSELTGLPEDVYNVGDTVLVADEERAAGVEARVARIVRKPKAPHLGKVELSYLPIAFPSPNVGAGRPASTQSWELFTSRNSTGERKVLENQGTSILNRIDLATIAGAEWVVGWSLNGVAVGTGTLSVTAFDAGATGDLIPLDGQVRTVDLVDGEPFTAAFSYGDLEVFSGQHELKVRVEVTGATRVDIPQNGAALWVLARGAVERAAALENSIRFDHLNQGQSDQNLQQWTVPDDVERVRITCYGGAGFGGGSLLVTNAGLNCSGKGARVSAEFTLADVGVQAGDVLDIYAPGSAVGTAGGWPNGGRGGNGGASNDGHGGGGAAYVTPAGAGMAGALIVAAGGGGTADQGISRRCSDGNVQAGDGAFYEAPGGSGSGPHNAGGASQLVPSGGSAGATAGSGPNVEPNTAGAFDAGGTGGAYTSSFVFPGGGGGGGWYGGGGAGGATLIGGGTYGGDGGGGCGYVHPAAVDLDYSDGVLSGEHGYVVIEWDVADVDV